MGEPFLHLGLLSVGVVLAPLLWYSAVVYVADRWDRIWLRRAFQIAVLIGVFHALAAVPHPFEVSPWNWLMRKLGLGSVTVF